MLAGLVVVLHVIAVFVLVAGVVGRDLLYGRAARSEELDDVVSLVAHGSLFEKMVRTSTLAVLVLGLAAAWARGWPILGFLQGAPVNWVLAALLIYLSIIPMIVFVFLPRGRVFRQALEQAVPLGRVTPALRAALHDPWVHAARTWEIVMVVVLTALMVLKPF
jgi:hypothetical protein